MPRLTLPELESKKQTRSRQRVADHGEVFTAEREVNAVLDLVKQENERITINNNLQEILNSINDSFVVVKMGKDNWDNSIPTSPGWYVIKTNTPVDILEKVGDPKAEAYINIPKAIDETKEILPQGLVIKQKNNELCPSFPLYLRTHP